MLVPVTDPTVSRTAWEAPNKICDAPEFSNTNLGVANFVWSVMKISCPEQCFASIRRFSLHKQESKCLVALCSPRSLKSFIRYKSFLFWVLPILDNSKGPHCAKPFIWNTPTEKGQFQYTSGIQCTKLTPASIGAIVSDIIPVSTVLGWSSAQKFSSLQDSLFWLGRLYLGKTTPTWDLQHRISGAVWIPPNPFFTYLRIHSASPRVGHEWFVRSEHSATSSQKLLLFPLDVDSISSKSLAFLHQTFVFVYKEIKLPSAFGMDSQAQLLRLLRKSSVTFTALKKWTPTSRKKVNINNTDPPSSNLICANFKQNTSLKLGDGIWGHLWIIWARTCTKVLFSQMSLEAISQTKPLKLHERWLRSFYQMDPQKNQPTVTGT